MKKTLIEMTGQTFGKWTVLGFADKTPRNMARWYCRCECGRERVVSGATLRNGTSRNCGCVRSASVAAGNKSRRRELAGLVVGRLTAIRPIDDNGGWLCQCECGGNRVVSGYVLHNGEAYSCGCSRPEPANKTHGKTHTPEYNTWCCIKARCENPNNPAWNNYGGRGIRVCDRWRDSFETFLLDVGERPGPVYSLDRYPDGDGDYEPGNVRWATAVEQGRNTRRVIRITIDGQTRPLAEWCEKYGVRTVTARMRLEAGWEPLEAISTPVAARAGKTNERQRITNAYHNMIGRCYNPRTASFRKYGAKGVTVCQRWRESFHAFRDDMGARPSPIHSLDRRDGTKGYWCGKTECNECGPANRVANCRWATPETQLANRKKPGSPTYRLPRKIQG